MTEYEGEKPDVTEGRRHIYEVSSEKFLKTRRSF